MKYPGAKRAAGVPETIIANIPYHKWMYSFFAGIGHIEFLKKHAPGCTFLYELNDDCIKYLKSIIATKPGPYMVRKKDAFIDLQSTKFDRECFIYLDPPYIAESRRSTRKLYKYEMMEEKSHTRLLKLIRTIDANIMISTKESPVHDIHLHDWRKVKIKTIDRSGQVYYEVIYMNYPADCILHQYDYIGKDKGERQANKRTLTNIKNKVARLSPHLKQAFIKTIIDNNSDISQHFLNTLPGRLQ